MKRILLPVCLVIGALLALPATASAAPRPAQKESPVIVSVATLVDRPDSTSTGTWATDQLTRTVRIYPMSLGDNQCSAMTPMSRS